MTEREMKKDKAEEEVRHRKKSPDAALEKVKAQNEMPEASAMDALSPKAYAILLSDPRFSHPTNAEQKARIVSGLQHSHGNTSVQRLLKSRVVQAKLTVNPPDDQYEQEADRVAETVTKASFVQREAKPEEEERQVQTKLQRQVVPEEKEDEEKLRTKLQREAAPEEQEEPLQGKTAYNQVPEVSQRLEEHINAARGSGQPLPDSIRASLEPHFGRDFSEVRLHTDSEADRLAQQLQARAFTTGQDIFFREGDYQPDSKSGQRLLAHELTHVVQQTGLSSPSETAMGSSNLLGVMAISRQTITEPVSTIVIQRYTVPAELRCDQVVDWLNKNSPYAPEWAETRCDYTFEGELKANITTQTNGKVKITVKGHPDLKVNIDAPIDEPEWSPSDRKNRDAEVKAWDEMMAKLHAHEKQHRKIGEKWRSILEQKFKSVNFTVVGDDEADAMAKVQEKITTMQEKWKADSQKAQSAIDPFRGAVLKCPPSEESKP